MLFNKSIKNIQPGSVINYKSQTMLVWKINESGKMQLIQSTGRKFPGTPLVKPDIKVLGSYPLVQFNGTHYIITDNNNIYSTSSGKKVYETENSNSIRLKILKLLKSQQS